MSRKRIQNVTSEYLKQVSLPVHASTYTVIPHETVINNALEQLKLKGFFIESESYRANGAGDVAIGIYKLNYKSDPDMGMMFAWSNSYDKSLRFKSCVGGFVRVSDNSIIAGDFSWGRKHTGTADQEMILEMNNQILNGSIYYDQIVETKDQMKDKIVTENELSSFLGRAFFNKKLFSTEQIGIIRDEIYKPSFDYTIYGDIASLWTNYNHMLIALKKSHPRTWMNEQRDLHNYICQEFGLVMNPIVIPAPLVTFHTIKPVDATGILSTPEAIARSIERPLDINEIITEIKESPKPSGNYTTPVETIEDLADDIVIENRKVDEEKTMERANPETYEKPEDPSISEEEQKKIDEAIAAMSGPKITKNKKTKTVNTVKSDLNLPD